ncbi:hypothetical protein HOB30_02805 [Candidatus Falkowbacteria bacterium]|jgi:hypothetical protein|nr:hypothetical protein [Candidatus Falkowbacteria bacterium]
MNKISNTIIRAGLPYCLYHVDSRFFNLNDENKTKIRFIKEETTPNRRTEKSKNIEMIRDRWGIDAHSKVEIQTNKTFEQKSEQAAENFTLLVINEFIKRYRNFSPNSVHLVPLISEDLFEFSMVSKRKGFVSLNLAGGIQPTNPLLNQQISENIQDSIANNEEIQLWQQLLLNAEQYLFQTEYRHSILESVIALELVVSEFIMNEYSEKAISEKDAKKYISDVGLTANIKITLRLFVKNFDQIEETVLEKCKAAITIRNNIVHSGRSAVTNEEAKDTLVYCKELINILKNQNK